MFAVIRIRGNAAMRMKLKSTLKMMRLDAPNNCTLVPENDSYKGQLQTAKDAVTWGEIEEKTLVELLKKRLRLKGNKRVDEKILKEMKIDSFEKFAKGLIEGKMKLKDFSDLQQNFRLTPPSKGFKSVKNAYPKGDLGYRGKEINKLLERMM
jgi:large subunit ribosomal protein L30